MGELDKKTLRNLLVGCGELYGREITTALFQMYEFALREYPVQKISLGFQQHLRDTDRGAFFPKPSDIIRNIETKSIKSISKNGNDYDFSNIRQRTRDESLELGASEIYLLKSGTIPVRLKDFTADQMNFVREKYGIGFLLN